MEDSEGNTPLHVKCYGETGEDTEVDCIELLLDRGASLTNRNKRVSCQVKMLSTILLPDIE